MRERVCKRRSDWQLSQKLPIQRNRDLFLKIGPPSFVITISLESATLELKNTVLDPTIESGSKCAPKSAEENEES